MDVKLERAWELKQALVEFVLEAEGELATALETYSAEQSRSQQQDRTQQDLMIDAFVTAGKIGNQTPLDLFLEAHPELPESDRQLISSWQRSFIGLFAVEQVLPDGFELMNWLTAKHYVVKPNNEQTFKEMGRFKPGEILLTRIAPVTADYWMFSGPCTLMGKLGKPKLAVAIGNFKQNYKSDLYSDAPELLEQAWQSVESYHQDFVDFFGSDEVTLSGYQLGKKLAEFQEVMTQRQLKQAGIDSSKSLAETAAEAGVAEEEITAMAEAIGADAEVAAQLLHNKAASKMVTPKIELPAELKKAEQVTVIAHPRWGQVFLPTYTQVKTILESEDWQSIPGSEKLLHHYLKDPTINPLVWYRLAEQYPVALEKILQTLLNRPGFNLKQDLAALLQEFHKPIEPELPEIASVPLHLHTLFQAALVEVSKTKSKEKTKVKPNKGFMR